MRRLDALGEIPAELAGAYDVVQVRLFQVVVRDNDPGPLLRNVVGMLSEFFLLVSLFPPLFSLLGWAVCNQGRMLLCSFIFLFFLL